MLKHIMNGAVSSLRVGTLTAHANLEVLAAVSVYATADFCEALARSGAWIETGSYERCWRPAGVAVERRPYSLSFNGRRATA
jgi:hypothetical protein